MNDAAMNTPDDIPSLRLCIACEECKPVGDFSLEHIFPESLGGNLCSSFFKTHHVCRSCNSTMGTFVDAPFIRSWFIKNGVTSMLDFVDLSSDTSWIPLIYMGPSQVIDLPEDEACEIWLGPSGEHVYHFHAKDDRRFDGYAGGNPIARKKDPGRIYIFVTHQETKRIALLLRSTTKGFKKAKRFAGNFGFSSQGLSGEELGIHPLPVELKGELQTLKTRLEEGAGWKINLPIQLGFEQRFLAKLARGLGFNLFGERYLTTPRAKELKAALWEQDYEKRTGLVKSSSIFEETLKSIGPIIGIRGVYTVTLMPVGHVLALALTLPSGHVLATCISEDLELWISSNFGRHQYGVIYFIAPQANFFHGPVEMPNYLQHKLHGPTIAELAELENRRIGWTVLSKEQSD